jgi:two-component system OmpR family sensor kinase
MTLRARLAAAGALVLLVLAVGGWVVVQTVANSQRDQLDRQVRSAVPTAFQAYPPSGPRPVLGAGTENFSDLYVALVEPDGTLIRIAARQVASESVPELPTVSTTQEASMLIQTVDSTTGSGRWRAALISNNQNGTRVLVAVSLQRADATERRLGIAVGVVGVATLAAIGLAGWWILRLGLRPIAEVTEVADAIAAGERHRRVQVRTLRTEAGHLGRAFNVMLDERQASEDRLRRFIADASHELRTPVASIRAFADLYRQGGLDDAGLDDAMRRIGGESARMAGLVEDLLLLARLDDGRPVAYGVVDLTTVLDDAVLDVSVTHPSRTIVREIDRDLWVVGDDARIRQVVANLVHNALTHAGRTPAGTEATVTVRGEGRADVCILTVRDDGQGMSPADSGHAFDRFWRAEASRVRSGSGAGLGLSIVRAIAEAHGGGVSLETEPGRGTAVRVVLPRTGAPVRLPVSTGVAV